MLGWWVICHSKSVYYIVDCRIIWIISVLDFWKLDLCLKLLCFKNPFEFIWNLKTSFEIWKFDINLKKKISFLKIHFKCGPSRVVQCVCIQPCNMKNLHMAPLRTIHVWNKFSDMIILFQMEIEFSNSKTRFEISNKFKWIFKR